MPEAAVATGVVDLVLTPEEMAEELPRIARHEPVAPPARADDGQPSPLERIFRHLDRTVGVDFAMYKKATVSRRIQRRMAVRRTNDLATYARILEKDPDEVQSLFRDLLIHVTRFFREPEAFEALKAQGLPEILGPEARARIWVPGCASGEEAYTVAILVLEHLGDRSDQHEVQIFATDLTEHEIERARLGTYPESIEADVSPERLRRFFKRTDGGYRVSKAMRDLCVFARHDLTRDPPFSKLDLVVCRNLLIYLARELQERVMGTLHYALREGGYLMLGSSETIGSRADLFGILDKKHRIYRRKPGPGTHPATTQGHFRPRAERTAVRAPKRGPRVDIDRYLAERYAPAALLVDAELTIVETRGRTGRLLDPQPGEASLSLRRMIRPELADVLGALLAEARDSGKPARSNGVHLRGDGDGALVDVETVPLGPTGERCFLVLVEDREESPEAPGRAAAREPDDRSTRLEQELASSRQHMNSMIHDLEAANEELQSANEEILSTNEELQSTNEELDTAREELQSTNEELNTVNDELHARNEELSRVNSDLTNLVASMNIAVVIVDRDLRIRRFTPEAERVLNLIAGDLGRPIVHVRPNVDVPELETLIHRAIEDVEPSEREVQDASGRWYSLRVRPYKSQDNRIDGAVLSLVDIEGLKSYQAELAEARDYAEAIVQTVRHPLVVLDRDLRVVTVNDAFCRWFRLDRAGTERRLLAELDGGRWVSPELLRVLTEVLPKRQVVESFALDGRPPGNREGRLVLNARRMKGRGDQAPLILVAMDVETTADEGRDGA